MNSTNFFIASRALFHECEVPEGAPDFISPDGSEYRYTRSGVVRTSDHWGPVAFCRWSIETRTPGLRLQDHPEYEAKNTAIGGQVIRVSAKAEWRAFSWRDESAEFYADVLIRFAANPEAVAEIVQHLTGAAWHRPKQTKW